MLAFQVQTYINPVSMPWQIPLLAGAFLSWILGGGFFLKWMVSRTLRKMQSAATAPAVSPTGPGIAAVPAPDSMPRLHRRGMTLGRGALTMTLSALAAAALGGVLVMLISALGDAMKSSLTVVAAVAGGVGALAGGVLTMYAMLNLPLRRMLAAALLTLAAAGAASGAFLVCCALPAKSQVLEKNSRTACYIKMSLINKGLAAYALKKYAYPNSLEELSSDSMGNDRINSNDLKCPGAPEAEKIGYLYRVTKYVPARSSEWSKIPEEEIRVADFRSNHHGEGRNVLFTNTKQRWVSEAEFQKLLAMPINEEFKKLADANDK